jgi:hypothetical protein
MADAGKHLSTVTHRRTVAASARETTPAGRHAYSARKAAARTAYQSLARWDDQYADADPGNSPEWNREYADDGTYDVDGNR